MKLKQINLIILMLLSAFLCSGQDLVWKSKKSIPQYGLHGSTSFVINGKAYVALGRLQNGNYTNALWEYNPTLDRWTQKANYPGGAIFSPVGFAVNGKGYVGLGIDKSGNRKTDLYEYNPTTNTWTKKSSFPGTARYDAMSFVIGNAAYVGTGHVGSGYSSDMYMYLPATDQWVTRASFPGSNAIYVASFVVGSYAYCGNATLWKDTPSNRFWRYNPSSNSWTSIASMPGTARRMTRSFTLDGKGYVGSGTYSKLPITSYLNDYYEYNPTTNSWTQKRSNSEYTSRLVPSHFVVSDSLVYSACGLAENGYVSELWKLSLNLDTCDFVDTTLVVKHDTVKHDIYDTTFVSIYDTTRVTINDTIQINIYDTTSFTVYDTIVRYDTLFVQHSDTVVFIDTIITNVYDTLTTRIYDTSFVAVTDTLFIRLPATGGSPNEGCDLIIYPNPTDNLLFIDTKQACTLTGYSIRITNDIGQLVYQSVLRETPYKLDLSLFMVNGIYMVEVKRPNGTIHTVRTIILY